MLAKICQEFGSYAERRVDGKRKKALCDHNAENEPFHFMPGVYSGWSLNTYQISEKVTVTKCAKCLTVRHHENLYFLQYFLLWFETYAVQFAFYTWLGFRRARWIQLYYSDGLHPCSKIWPRSQMNTKLHYRCSRESFVPTTHISSESKELSCL